MVDNIPKNIFRGIHKPTGEIRFFVGSYDPQIGYSLPPPHHYEKVTGRYNEQKRFSTLAEAIEYKGYTDYAVAAQMALSYYKTSRIVPKGWDADLGDDYVPWHPKWRGRRGVKKK